METTAFLARAIAARVHAPHRSPLAAAVAARLRRNRNADPAKKFTAQGFAMTVQADEMLAIDCRAGGNLQVIGGRAWITAEGALDDVFADCGGNVALAEGTRFQISALRDATTIVVTFPECVRDAQFEMHVVDGKRTLRLSTGGRPVVAALRALAALVADIEARLFAPLTLSSARSTR